MIDKDVILAKVAIIQRCLQRIKDVTSLDPKSLEEIDTQDIFVLNLQRAIQAVIDIATHVVGSEGWNLPDTFKGNFVILFQKKIINKSVSEKMQRMVGFRNIAVHDYQNIDVEILKNILKSNLADLEAFYDNIIRHNKLNR